MAGSTSNLDLIATAQAQKEVTANALFDAGSTALLFGRRASTCAGLTWGYYGGPFRAPGGMIIIANATIALTANATNYIEADEDGVVSNNTTAFTVPSMPLYAVVCGATTVTNYTDWRALPNPLTVFGVSSVAMTVPAEWVVAGTPITDTGTLAITKATQVMRTVWAGPTSGAAAQPTFRALTQDDLPVQPFDVHAFYPGVPTASAVVVRTPVARPVTFAADFAGSYFTALAGATAAAVFTVKKNSTTIGTITINTLTATWATTGGTAQSLAAGDVLSIIAPPSADATLSDPGFVLAGTR